MNTQKSVYNRLFSKEEKTELESQKIELGLIDDYDKKLLGTESDKFVDNARRSIKEAAENFKKASNYFNELVKEGDEIIKKAQDLGATQAIKSVKNNQKMAKQLAKDFARDAATVSKLA